MIEMNDKEKIKFLEEHIEYLNQVIKKLKQQIRIGENK